ncbi:MAG: type IIL restriction-modification enzyme MmeI [Geitlerinemataceae cyanobacterium]
MNAVEIEEAVSYLAEKSFDPEEFPFAFLEAFGNKPTTLKRLKNKQNSSNQSDLPGGVLQRNNIHLKVCPEGEVTATLAALRESPATTKYKAKFLLATDGKSFEAENLADGETVACNYPDFHNHFGFFLALAGIATVKQIRENAFDIKATSRLNRLYVELLKENPDWDAAERREEMNHFMARLIFCFFAEDTNIFHSEGLFTATVAQMSAADSSNTHEVLSEVFRSMCTPLEEREAAGIRNWANGFPYVNGGLFSPHPLTPSPKAGEGGQEALAPLSQPGRGAGGEGLIVPRFSKIARSYLLHVGNLDWTQINPDIFGSMIQAVTDEAERGALGMHYTSVPNILKVLNPLIFKTGHEIAFAHTSFKWANLASHNAGVTVVIVGISNHADKVRQLFSIDDNGETVAKKAENINAYLVAGANVIVEKTTKPLGDLFEMTRGNTPYDGGNLLLSLSQVDELQLSKDQRQKFIRRIHGSAEFVRGLLRYCFWIDDLDLDEALALESISQRIEAVRLKRLASPDKGANAMANKSHQFREMNEAQSNMIVIPRVTSENRPILPVGILSHHDVIGDRNFALYDAPLWNMALIASRLHWVWIGTVCVRMRTDFSYSNTLGWNTFPVPTLTDRNKADLTRCAEDILLAREQYFPATIAEMYDPNRMDSEFPLVREAHERNDEILERIYIGRRFKNDTERLEKLFELYTKMTAQPASLKKSATRKGGK